MRVIILLFIVLSSTLSIASTTKLCDTDETPNLLTNKDILILKCNCNCTNEENKFYFLSKNKVLDSLNASRLVSLNGLNNTNFLELKRNGVICKDQDYRKNYKNSVILATKVPIDNGECFYLQGYNYPQKIESKENTYYRLKKAKEFSVIPKIDIDNKLKSIGLYELSNNLINDARYSFLKEGTILISVYKNDNISIVKTDSNEFIDVNITDLDEFFKISSISYLYKLPNQKTNMYLIKGDQVTILDEQTDNTNQKWYFINYKGKKDINMWIKAEAVDVIE